MNAIPEFFSRVIVIRTNSIACKKESRTNWTEFWRYQICGEIKWPHMNRNAVFVGDLYPGEPTVFVVDYSPPVLVGSDTHEYYSPAIVVTSVPIPPIVPCMTSPGFR